MELARRVTPWRLRVGLFALAAVVMLGFVTFAPNSLRPKSSYNDFTSFYQPVAENLVAGRGLTNTNGTPALHNPPGYVFAVAGVYLGADALGVSRDGALTAFAVVVMATCAVLVFEIGYRLFGKWAGMVGALLWMTYPVNLIMAVYQFSEVPFTLLLCLLTIVALRLLQRNQPSLWWAFVLGVLAAAAALVRPAGIALLVPLAIGLWVLRRDQSRRWRGLALAVLLAGNIALVVPWEGWVYATYDKLVPLSTAGEGSMLDGITVGFRPKDESGHAAMPDGLRHLMARAVFQPRRLSSTSEIASFLKDEIAKNPLVAPELIGVKAARSLYGTNRLELEGVIAAVQFCYLCIMLVGGRRAWRRGGSGRRALGLILLLTGYFWLVTITVLSIVRYMSPVLGLLFPFAALTFVAGDRRPAPASAGPLPPSSGPQDREPEPAATVVPG